MNPTEPRKGERELRRMDLQRAVPCRKCGAALVFIVTDKGSRMPMSVPSARPVPCPACTTPKAGECVHCGCTEDDCRGCVARQGAPCSWVAVGLCSCCADLGPPESRRRTCERCASVGIVYALISHFADCPNAADFRSRKK